MQSSDNSIRKPNGRNYQEPSKWHYLPADVSWQKTSLRHSAGGTSGCSASPDPPSLASWTPAGDWYPGTLSYLNTEDRIREALVRHGSKDFYKRANQHQLSWWGFNVFLKHKYVEQLADEKMLFTWPLCCKTALRFDIGWRNTEDLLYLHFHYNLSKAFARTFFCASKALRKSCLHKIR